MISIVERFSNNCLPHWAKKNGENRATESERSLYLTLVRIYIMLMIENSEDGDFHSFPPLSMAISLTHYGQQTNQFPILKVV
jgi:hypothetical protein